MTDRYYWKPLTSGDHQSSEKVCYDCGARVSNSEVHDRFHDWLSAIAQTANNADMMWRPIG